MAGSWLLSQGFPSHLNGNHKGSCSAILLFALCSRWPETLFQDEFIMQKPSEKLGDERERGKEGPRWVGSQMQQERPGTYLQGWTKRWERGCSKGVLRECCAADVEVLLGIFLPGYLWPWRGHLSFLTWDGWIGNFDVLIGTCWSITQAFAVETKDELWLKKARYSHPICIHRL